ncbi:UPF0172-domain-containing protein [Basidiobolus meristosporus CBS 931.73]|uniref:UPF0172-domain-containing protein n=1 Tax=Basidiobolus meristosporus CBS 931.73 TaxID=1314790 RepID=A0A1Y1Z4Z5_9FUNG|nr:UPF0172-domain-containing protein [Basidiobolus meristosporus CBS 931.73]|eukprot:ORY05333.1 UPF0172-domain-containing protein [Basidiobolus meristosporus CBS 931.73]
MPTYNVASAVYSKIIFHAARYPHQLVNGVILGKKSGSGYTLVDVVPLFHQWTNLEPMLEVALRQIEIYSEQNGTAILGYYQANSGQDKELGPVGNKIANKIVEFEKDAVVLMVDNTKLSIATPQVALSSYTYQEKQWRHVKSGLDGGDGPISFKLEAPEIVQKTAQLIGQRSHLLISDFDEHLEDVSKDWLGNGEVNNVIKA